MDVEGLMNLEDYVALQKEKQIAKVPSKAPKYEMDPRFWQIPSEPPPPYEDEEPLAIEGPDEGPPPEDDEESYLTPPEDEEVEDDKEESEANKILDQLGLPNYDDVEKTLAQPEMTDTRKRNYLEKKYLDIKTERHYLRLARAVKSPERIWRTCI